MSATPIPYDHTLPGVDNRVTEIERQLSTELAEGKLKEAATKGDIAQLEKKIDTMFKFLGTCGAIFAAAALPLILQHV